MNKTPETEHHPSDRERRLGLIASIVTISVAAAGFGHSIPLLAVLLEDAGVSSTFIGLNSAIGAVSMILGTPFMPPVIKRMGVKAFIFTCLLIMIGAYGGLYVTKDALWLWFPLRFTLGLAGAGLFAASEFWVSTVAKDENRGAIIGIYGTCLALGFALGPFLIQLTGYYTVLPFIAGIAVFSLAFIPVGLVRGPVIEAETGRFAFFPQIRQAPGTFLAAAFFGGTEASIFAFLPIIILDWGFDDYVSAQVVTAYALGAVSLQFVIGKYSDRVGRTNMLLACTVITVICIFLFMLYGQNIFLLYAMLFIWGASVEGLYTVGLASLGDFYKDAKLADANMGYVFMYGVGALAGPAIIGVLRDIVGNAALPGVLAAFLSAYFILLFVRRRHETP